MTIRGYPRNRPLGIWNVYSIIAYVTKVTYNNWG